MSDKETAFLGKMTAGMTHEFMNVLATIGQTSGLMEDLIALSLDESFPHHEKFRKIVKTIKTQVVRGTEIGTRLKDFAHSMDEASTRIDVNEIMGQVVFMMQRFARLRKLNLDFIPLEAQPDIEVDLFRLEVTLARCVECCMECSKEGDTIRLQSEDGRDQMLFRIFIESGSLDPERAVPSDLTDIRETLSKIGARIRSLDSPGKPGLEIAIPR